MRFVHYSDAVPKIIVDGTGTGSTVLVLSHWRRSGTPPQLMADTSTEIVFNYLDSPQAYVDAEGASNNHFDEDGLAGIYALVNPEVAQRHRDLLIDVASTGDFGVCKSRHAARIVFTIEAFSDKTRSPLPQQIFKKPYLDLSAGLYAQLLDRLTEMLPDVEPFREYWEQEDRRLSESEDAIRRGEVRIDQNLEFDFAVVRSAIPLHDIAICSATPCTRLLLFRGRHVEFRYRYESWVQLASRRPKLRVDLSALTAELNERERNAPWVSDRADSIVPRLRQQPDSETSIDLDVIQGRIEYHLRTGKPAWNPYD